MDVDPPARLLDPQLPASTIAVTSAELADRYAGLQVRCQRLWDQTGELVHRSRVQQARRQTARARGTGLTITPPGWFAVEGIIDGQVVRASWTDGRLACDELLRSRAALLVALEEEFVSADPPRRYVASLQAPPMAVALTLVRACDSVAAIELDAPSATGTNAQHGSRDRGGRARPPIPGPDLA
jgi:hypothetical protein